MTAQAWNTISVIAFLISGLTFALSVFLFFRLHIVKLIEDLTGRTVRKSAEVIRRNNSRKGKMDSAAGIRGRKEPDRLRDIRRNQTIASEGEEGRRQEAPPLRKTAAPSGQAEREPVPGVALMEEDPDTPTVALIEADMPAWKPAEETDTPTGKLEEEADTPTRKLEEETDTPAGKLEEEADTPTGKLAEEADTPTRKLAEEADTPTGKLAEEADTPAGKLEEEADTPTGKLEEEADTPAGKLEEEADTPTGKLTEEADTPAGKLEEEADTPTGKLTEEADTPAAEPAGKTCADFRVIKSYMLIHTEETIESI